MKFETIFGRSITGPFQLSVFCVACYLATFHVGISACLGFQDPKAGKTSKINENWPHWRGPSENGHAAAKPSVLKFSKQLNVRFRTPLPGPAGSTPVLWGEKIFLTSVDGDDFLLMCFSTEGKELWRQKIGSGNKIARAGEGNSASPSPSTDGKNVWAMMCDGTLVCFTTEGKEVWKQNLQEKYGKFDIQFGMTSSPLLHEGKLFIQLIHGKMNRQKGFGTVIAMDAASGKEIWKIRRESDATVENKHSYASPVYFDNGQFQYLLTHGADYLIAHDPANGKEIWRYGSFHSRKYNPFLRLVATPVVSKDLIIVPTAKNGPVIAIKPGGKGNITQSDYVLWRNPKGTPDVPSPIVTSKYVFLCGEKGIITCLDRQTGEEYFRERTNGHLHRASPVLAGDYLIITSRKGVVTVLKASDELEIVSKNPMNETITASPVVAGGRIYLRSFNALYAIGAN